MQSTRDVLSAHHGSPAIVVSTCSLPEGLSDENIAKYDDSNSSIESFDNMELGNEDAHHQDEDGSDNEDESYGQDPDNQQRSDYLDLGDLLRKCGIRHAHKDKNKLFWPTGLLYRTLTRDRVIEELQARVMRGHKLRFGWTPPTLAGRILRSHIKIFAILAMLDKIECIDNIIHAGLDDSHLPLKCRGTACQLYHPRKTSSPSQPISCFSGKGWKTHERECFSHLQHAVDPRVLELETDGRTPKHEEFKPEAVLPFVYEGRRCSRQEERQYGGYGFVTVAKIHPDCHKFHRLLKLIGINQGFALKQLVNEDRHEFQQEVDALKVFNGFAHPHMVTLLMTWTYRSKYFLLFPLAKYDLGKYWEEEPVPKIDKDMVLWMSEQLVGIAGAVASIHDPGTGLSGRNYGASSGNLRVPGEEHKYGRHGDLKPENILLYESQGTGKGMLVVADMGLSKLNTILSRSTQSNSRVPATPRYKPPECDIEGAKITRSYDIWTFGCLALEWVCWLFGGQSARESFIFSLLKEYPPGTRKDMFFDMIPKRSGDYRVEMKPEVTQKLEDLHADAYCTPYFHDLLDLIEERMVVIRAKDRIGSNELHQTLRQMNAMLHSDRYQRVYMGSSPKRPQEPLDVVFRRRDSTKLK
ncbi:kinase-like protein [Ophiobolus disseminans]|uniref:Kinase-like protein n=1 Tax=Ophiobolus disseminans TaxID=1469910 RepID=A0A6A6ZPQ8_9PLEO|nr:kinase-like protein [Ophiobolus disseminans]